MEPVLTFDFWTVLYLLLAGFVGAFLDASVGGGGLITLPAYLSLGWPIPFCLGTNKAANGVCLCTSAYTYFRSGKVDPFVWRVLPCSFVAAVLGALAVYIVPPDILRSLVVGMLVFVGIYTFLKKDIGQVGDRPKAVNYKQMLVLLAVGMGFYDGFFGPGSGMFYIFCYLLLGYDYVCASANSKVMTSICMLAAILAFAYQGSIIWSYAVIMAIGGIPGAIVGSKFVIKYGAKWIRPLFMAMVVIMIGKQVMELFK